MFVKYSLMLRVAGNTAQYVPRAMFVRLAHPDISSTMVLFILRNKWTICSNYHLLVCLFAMPFSIDFLGECLFFCPEFTTTSGTTCVEKYLALFTRKIINSSIEAH